MRRKTIMSLAKAPYRAALCSSAAIFAIVSIVMVSCGIGDMRSIDSDEVSVERQASLTNEKESPTCEVRLKMTYLKESYGELAHAVNRTVVKRLFDLEGLTMEQAADSFANVYIRSYKLNFAPLYRDDRGDEQKKAWYEYRYNIDTHMESRLEHVMTYFVNLDYYEGGAHGITQLLTMNFDEKTGEYITLSDIFIPGYESQLSELLLEKLLQATGAKNIEDLHDKGYLYSMDMFAPENFILNDDGITFIYNPYEIAPYSIGRTELSVSNEEIEGLRK